MPLSILRFFYLIYFFIYHLLFACFYFFFTFFLLFATIAPGAPPTEVRGVVIDSRTVLISWQPPPREKQHGNLTEYKVIYSKVHNNNLFSASVDEDSLNSENNIFSFNEKHVNSGELVATAKPDAKSIYINDLEEWTEYQFRILAANKVGNGPASDTIFLRTDEAGMS